MDKKLRHERILDCRYYNGEVCAPNNEYALFWDYEQGWANGKYEGWESEKQDILHLGLDQWLYEEDGTHPDFKCLLFNRYCHWIGMFEDPEEFVKWYRESYVFPRQTNRQRRYLQRKEKLLKKCKFYKGEGDCPYKDSKDEHFWKYEKIWVDRLSHSYTYAYNWRNELTSYKNLHAFVKEHGLPSSYIGLLVNRDIHWLGFINEQDFLKSIKKNYLKIKE